MGRFLNTTTSTTTDANLHGTPKRLPTDVSRACYAMLSSNGSLGGIVFMDKFFQTINSSTRYTSSTGSMTPGNYLNVGNDDISNSQSTFTPQVANTATQASSNGTNTYMNAVNTCGEFGQVMVDTFSNSTVSNTMVRHGSWDNKHYLNLYFVNSDHNNKRIVYILNSNVFRAVDRINGSYSYDRPGTMSYTLPDGNASMTGSASYNNVRKELVILKYINSSGQYQIITYKNIDFDLYPSPHLAFVANGVTKNVSATFTIPSWNVNNNESYYNIKPILCDDGSIFVSVMFSSSTLSLFRIVRNVDLTISSTTLQSSVGLTTSYGVDQGFYYGLRQMQSRDMNSVISFCPYYYYGCGLRSYIVNKRLSIFTQSSVLDSTSSAAATQPLPYGDSGFTSWFCGNVYAGNPQGAYLTGSIDISPIGTFVQTSSTKYLTMFPLPNTTNYPGMTQVTDFSLLDNQNINL